MKQDKLIIAIGGGDLKAKSTLAIDRIIADAAKRRAGDRRAVALFVGTASHDSMPYYNTFHKTYTGELGLKTDCALTVYGEMDSEKIRDKFAKADLVYVGGGDTVFMLDHWSKSGVKQLVLDAYERGVVICGLSAGAICWFDEMYTDSETLCPAGGYSFSSGLGLLEGCACPHYGERRGDFLRAAGEGARCLALTDDSAAVFSNGVLVGALSSGGQVYEVIKRADSVKEKLVKTLDKSVIL